MLFAVKQVASQMQTLGLNSLQKQTQMLSVNEPLHFGQKILSKNIDHVEIMYTPINKSQKQLGFEIHAKSYTIKQLIKAVSCQQ